MNEGVIGRLMELLPDRIRRCVMTGDYRGVTFGVFDAALDGMLRLRSCLREPVYGVLGNHDTVYMARLSKGWASVCCPMNPNLSRVR
jgi:uncharacterized protein